MGTRHFYATERKDSRIKWDKADPDMAQRLLDAINRQLKPTVVVRFFAIIPFSGVAMFLAYYFLILLKENPPLLFSFVYLAICGAFLVFLFLAFIKPFLFPIKRRDIWTFHAKCTDVSFYNPSRDHYFAYFQKGGGHISLKITADECKKRLPVGKEYIFYKFNNRTGNRWCAIPADTLDGQSA